MPDFNHQRYTTKLLRELTRQETGLQYLYTLLRYISQASNNLTATEIRQAIKTTFTTQGGDLVGTAAQEWIEEGKILGLQQGVREEMMAGIELGQELRFGAEGLALLPEIYKIDDVDVLRAIHQGLRCVETLEALRIIYRAYLPGAQSAFSAQQN